MGGLAEITNVFGGMLGSTFNYVFENQLTNLQNGDRFYYLARTPGMNLRGQLEGNSFAELVMRNTVNANNETLAHTLKADPFATSDCKFEIAHLTWPATLADPDGIANSGDENTIFGTGTVNNDPTTECDENQLLLRQSNGAFKYRAFNGVDPSGINGQSVFNGTDQNDRILGGNDNDTIWCGNGHDTVDGGGGDDVVLCGNGDDIITDFAGFDFLKGGPDNDAIDGGINDDIIIAGEGKDFTDGGANLNETFGGPGDDFAIAGEGLDAVFGDSGSDWEEGGDQPDLLIGDSSSLFFDDHNLPGHDVIIGQGGDDDYDMEGGDDIGVSGPGVEKIAGSAGWDWEIGQGDPQAQDMDLSLRIINALPVNEVRDRFDEVEALSGWNLNDTLRGDDVVPSAILGGAGFIGCNALDNDGVARITNLEDLVPASIRTVPVGPILEATSSAYCLLNSSVWGEGNILIGGAGSDTIEGRGADDIIDGDRYLAVRLSVRTDPADANSEIGTTNLMTGTAVSGNFGPGTAGMTLQQAVFARKTNPGDIVIVKEILTPTVIPGGDCAAGSSATNCDTAVFTGPAVNYSFVTNVDGSITVTDNGPPVGGAVRPLDGIDTLWNMEQLSFCEEDPSPLNAGNCLVNGGRTIVPVLPVASVSTSSLAFNNVPTNASSSLPITVTNSGIAPLDITSVDFTNPDGMFSLTNGCNGVSLGHGQQCIVTVVFSPTSIGDKTASVVINHNAGSSNAVSITGTGIAPIAVSTPSSFNFGTRNINSTTTTVINLNNTGNSPLTITNIQVLGAADGFTRTGNGCPAVFPATLSANTGSCSITVRFLPTTTGQKNGELRITSNSNNVPNNQMSVPLSGNAVISVPVASVNPTALNFGDLQVGSSFQQAVTLTNTGTGISPLTFSVAAIQAGSGFARVNGLPGNCGTSLAVGASCDITVRFFVPLNGGTAGAKTANLTITSNSGNVPGTQTTVPLNGNATLVVQQR